MTNLLSEVWIASLRSASLVMEPASSCTAPSRWLPLSSSCFKTLSVFLTVSKFFLESAAGLASVSYTHLRAHETPEHLVCRLLLEKKKTKNEETSINIINQNIII
eukprot:TRINITY_DN56805_c0_g1_i4.p1 TRINITY_DN56805_c0_g1~~TRINITY_DN56805_c0_g1_i4.p1  ORF type:complete len:105 (-),score=15.42 TRINITY_DN56805_c0_g1_i4:68-382(-)